MDVGKIITLQPHHIPCIECNKGVSYNAEHAQKFAELSGYLKTHLNDLVRITMKEDDLCPVCPHSANNKKTCDKFFINQVNKAWASFLGIQEGMVSRFGEFRDRLLFTVTPEVHEEICGRCGYWNFCKDVFKRLAG